MASTINAKSTGVGGIDASGDASGILQLQTGGTTALTIDASQNVGIGTSSTTPANGRGLIIYEATYPRLTLRNSATGTGATDGYGLVGVGNDLFVENSEVGNLVFTTSNTERMRLDSSGRLLIAASSLINGVDTAPLQVSGGSVTPLALRGGTNGYQIAFYNSAGNAVIGSITGSNGSTTAYNTASDQRLKENIVDSPSALVSVNAIKVRSFDWKSDGSHQEYGYIAQELLEVAPEAVAVPEDEDEMMGVDFGKLTPRLVKAIQELKAIIDTQNARIEALEAK